MKKNLKILLIIIGFYGVFLAVSFGVDFQAGKTIGKNFFTFSLDMLIILPPAFILIGLFEVWVKRETVEKHLGEGAAIWGYLWMILLAGTTVGGIVVALPVAYALYHKGAKLSIVFTYIGASAVVRVPMALFEMSFLGIKFTLIRLLVSLPLVIITALILGSYLKKKNYALQKGK